MLSFVDVVKLFEYVKKCVESYNIWSQEVKITIFVSFICLYISLSNCIVASQYVGTQRSRVSRR